MSGTNSPPFPLGVYVGGPSATDPTAEAQFEAQFNAFTNAMGTKPTFMNAFTNFYADESGWVADQTSVADSWAASPVLRGVTPVISLPMASVSQQGNQDAIFKAIAAGQYDNVYTGIINAWKAAGYSTLDARIGYEMNGAFEPYYSGSDPQTVADWVTAFQHIADLVHNVPGTTVKTVWNPADLNWTAQPTINSYPGDKYVDVIGADIYSVTYPVQLYDWALNNGTIDSTAQQWFSNPINREHYWMNPNATEWNQNGYDPSQWGLKQALQLAQTHNKPIGFAEVGAGGDGTTDGPVDDGTFPTWLAQQLKAPGAPPVAFVNVWDTNVSDGNWAFTDGSKPNEAAAWVQSFGVPGNSTPVAAPPPSLITGTGTDTLTLNLSEDAYQGDAQFTVSIDGQQIGGVYTVQALHKLGQDQSFVFNGNWGPQGHTVAVTFLNDAWGGSSAADRNLYIDSIAYDGTTQATNVEQATNGTQTFGVGTSATSASFVDSAGARYATSITSSPNQTLYSNQTGLQGNLWEWTESGGVIGLGTSTFNLVQETSLTDTSGASFHVYNFAQSDLNLSGGPTGTSAPATVTVDNAMRGSMAFGTGNYNATVNVQSPYADQNYNTFHVSFGSGNDNFVLNGDPSKTFAVVTAGSGTDTISFANVLNAQVYGGSGAATVSLGNSAATVNGGTGSIDVTGGSVADTYAYHSGNGLLKVENFSQAKGDLLQVDTALQSALKQSVTSAGLLLSFGGTAGSGILLAGVNAPLASSAIHWT